MAKNSYKERARYQREQEILRTAARMIRDKGYVNLNMDELAEEVGISKPTLYQHFKGKDEMVRKAMRETMLQMESHVMSIDGGSPIDKLTNIMRYMLEAHADPDGFSMAITRDPSIAIKHLSEETGEMKESQMRIARRIYELIDHAKADGDIRQDIPNVVVISTMFASLSILQGPAIMRDHSMQAEHLIDNIIGFFRRGVSPN